MIIDEDRLLAHLDELEKSTKKKHGKKNQKTN
jgi:hypothetical protein